MEKLQKAEFLAGQKFSSDKKILEKFEKELKTEFIPELYDKSMDKVFDEKFYESVDKKQEKKQLKKQKDIDLKILRDQFQPDEEDEERKSEDS